MEGKKVDNRDEIKEENKRNKTKENYVNPKIKARKTTSKWKTTHKKIHVTHENEKIK